MVGFGQAILKVAGLTVRNGALQSTSPAQSSGVGPTQASVPASLPVFSASTRQVITPTETPTSGAVLSGGNPGDELRKKRAKTHSNRSN